MDASPTAIIDDVAPQASLISPLTDNFLARSLRSAYTSFQAKRDALELPHPGSVEGVAREVQRSVFLTNQMFSGLRATLTSSFSASPLFQTAHNFYMGNQQLPPYDYAVIFGTPKVRDQLDNLGLRC